MTFLRPTQVNHFDRLIQINVYELLMCNIQLFDRISPTTCTVPVFKSYADDLKKNLYTYINL